MLRNSTRLSSDAQGLDPATDFEATFRSLLAAIKDVLPGLRETVVDDVQSAKDIVAELERSFMVSLTVSMTAHTTTLEWVKEWEDAHMEHLRGKRDDIGHYRAMRATNVDPANPYRWMPERPNFWADAPGSDRVHVQHLIAAIHSGSNMMVAGAGMRSFDYYPEVQTIQYGQWFAYMHAVWEEQFRGQLADFWSRGLPEDEPPIKSTEITSDFFGDIRLIRNDFVHNKGEVGESANLKCLGWDLTPGEPIRIEVERMVELMDKFPRVELVEPPQRRTTEQPTKTQPRKNMPGSGKTELVDQFFDVVARNQFNKGRAIDEMLEDWIKKHQSSVSDA